MASSKDEVYVSFSPSDYRTNKSSILMSQVDLLETLKRLYKLKVLARQKKDLKIKLHKLLSSALASLDSIEEKLPEPKVPKIVHKHQKKAEKLKETFSRREDIEDELLMIQNKLRELNS